jgi:hypothetical protein
VLHIAGSRAGWWQDPAWTDPVRAHQRVRDGSLNRWSARWSLVLEPDRAGRPRCSGGPAGKR